VIEALLVYRLKVPAAPDTIPVFVEVGGDGS
jgi:hypothetical protein